MEGYRYYGLEITPCACGAGGWYVQIYRPDTDAPWPETRCPHYPTQAAAESAAREGRQARAPFLELMS